MVGQIVADGRRRSRLADLLLTATAESIKLAHELIDKRVNVTTFRVLYGKGETFISK